MWLFAICISSLVKYLRGILLNAEGEQSPSCLFVTVPGADVYERKPIWSCAWGPLVFPWCLSIWNSLNDGSEINLLSYPCVFLASRQFLQEGISNLSHFSLVFPSLLFFSVCNFTYMLLYCCFCLHHCIEALQSQNLVSFLIWSPGTWT